MTTNQSRGFNERYMVGYSPGQRYCLLRSFLLTSEVKFLDVVMQVVDRARFYYLNSFAELRAGLVPRYFGC